MSLIDVGFKKYYRDDMFDSYIYDAVGLGGNMPIVKKWKPEIGEKILIKVAKLMYDSPYIGLEFNSNYSGLNRYEETTEERFFKGMIDDLYMVANEEALHCGTTIQLVKDVFEMPKKEYTMQEIANSLGIKVKDLRIKE